MKNSNYNLKDYLFLFDIDGTILDSQGCGKEAFVHAFNNVLKIEIKKNINFLGGIDNVIFKNLYHSFNLPASELDINWKYFEIEYVKKLKELSSKKKWILFKNVKNTISFLYDNSNIGIVTGNIIQGAKIKLEKFDLLKYFNFGAYGDHVENRNELVKKAINESSGYFNKIFENNNIYLFGDTEIDVLSAHHNNIMPVLIDPNKKHDKINSQKWAVNYHGSFEFIEIFLNEINLNSINKEILYFC